MTHALHVLAAARLLASLSLIGCMGAGEAPEERAERTADVPAPIRDGYDDDETDAFVGIEHTDDEGHRKLTCSGTLVARDQVLTAQHCVSDTPGRVLCPISRFGPLVDPADLRV